MNLVDKKTWFECLFLFVVIPTAIDLLPFKRGVFIILWLGAILCYAVLRKDASFDVKCYWNKAAVNWPNLKPVLQRFMVFAGILWIGVWFFMPERLFGLPKERSTVWLMVMCLYPLLSVYPQEIIYRAFFMHRYKGLFRKERTMILANAVVFGYGHLMFNHWITVILSAFGGLLFASTYNKTKSLGVVCIEHALYGCWIFTVGLGYYFYTGAVR